MTEILPIHQMPELYCPTCNKKLDAAMPTDPRDFKPPSKGDITFCAQCYTVMKFDKDYNLIIMEDDEISNLPTYILNQLAMGIMMSKLLRNNDKLQS